MADLDPHLIERINRLRVETPSWGYGNSGTRFKVFAQPGAARTVEEKLADAGLVHQLTGICPTVALHIPWDQVTDWKALKRVASSHGVATGAINPNLFQDDEYKLGSFCNPSAAIRRRAVDHVLECISIARETGSTAISLWLADGTNYPGQDDLRARLLQHRPARLGHCSGDLRRPWTAGYGPGRYRAPRTGGQRRANRRSPPGSTPAWRFPLQRPQLRRRRFDRGLGGSVPALPDFQRDRGGRRGCGPGGLHDRPVAQHRAEDRGHGSFGDQRPGRARQGTAGGPASTRGGTGVWRRAGRAPRADRCLRDRRASPPGGGTVGARARPGSHRGPTSKRIRRTSGQGAGTRVYGKWVSRGSSMNAARMVAVDLGAESGRVVAADFDGDRLSLEEVRRFPNLPVHLAGALQWDADKLREDVLAGLSGAGAFQSVGIDTWGVDFGLLDRSGNSLGNPGHYRDERTRGMIERAAARVPRQEIYRRTGVQFLEINIIYQLLALVLAGDARLRDADRLLTMPALVGRWLTPESVDEYTDATTTQCYDPVAGAWALDLLEQLGIPTHIFGPVVQPGTVLGPIRDELDLGAAVVVAPGTHDTASAVAAVPFVSGKHAAYISSGTWSLVGLELPAPLINDATLNANLTNEGGVAGTTRLLKNVMGLWLVQECRRAWFAAGNDYSYDQLLALAAQAGPFVAVIDPDDERLLRPGNMPALLVELAAESHQTLTADPGAIVRCVLESLAMKYRWTIERLESVTQREISLIHVVGGGARNALLCQMTADAGQRPVLAGPVEATAIGNVMLQAIALGLVDSLEQARELVRRSTEVRAYEPRSAEIWEPAWERFSAAQITATERRTS